MGRAGTRPARAVGIRAGAALLGLAALAVLPFFVSLYSTFTATLMMTNCIAVLGINIITGYSGQISIGHGAFYAIGAYITAILVTDYGMSCWLAVPVAGAACLVMGGLFGLPALRLEGHYLALATFCLAIAVPQLLKSQALSGITQGVEGIMLPDPALPSWLKVRLDVGLYYATLGFTLVMFAIAWLILRGRLGRAWLALRDHAMAASAMGINVARAKTLAFAISAAYAAVAGALGAIATRYVAPDSFDVFLSISFLVGAVVGGLSSIPGSIVGGIFILVVPNLAQDVSKAAPWAIYGCLLIACMLILPRGVWGAVTDVARRLSGVPRREPAGAMAVEGAET